MSIGQNPQTYYAAVDVCQYNEDHGAVDFTSFCAITGARETPKMCSSSARRWERFKHRLKELGVPHHKVRVPTSRNSNSRVAVIIDVPGEELLGYFPGLRQIADPEDDEPDENTQANILRRIASLKNPKNMKGQAS